MMAKQADWVPNWVKSTGKWVNRNVVTPVVNTGKATGRWVDRNVVTPVAETAQGIAQNPGGFAKDVGSSSVSTLAHVGTGLRDIPNQAKALSSTVAHAATERFMPEGNSKQVLKDFFSTAQDNATRDSHNLWATNARAQQQWARDTGWNVPHIGNSVRYGNIGAADAASFATNTAATAAVGKGVLGTASKVLPSYVPKVLKPYAYTQALLSGSETIPAIYNMGRTQVFGTDNGPNPVVLRNHIRRGVDAIPFVRQAFPLYHMQREIQKPSSVTGQPYILDSGLPLIQQSISRPYAFNNQSWWNPSPGTASMIADQASQPIDAITSSPYFDYVRKYHKYMPTPTPEQVREGAQAIVDPNNNQYGVYVNTDRVPKWFTTMSPYERTNLLLRIAPHLMRQRGVPQRFIQAVDGAKDLQINDPQTIR